MFFNQNRLLKYISLPIFEKSELYVNIINAIMMINVFNVNLEIILMLFNIYGITLLQYKFMIKFETKLIYVFGINKIISKL